MVRASNCYTFGSLKPVDRGSIPREVWFLLMERYYLTKGREAVSKTARSTKLP